MKQIIVMKEVPHIGINNLVYCINIYSGKNNKMVRLGGTVANMDSCDPSVEQRGAIFVFAKICNSIFMVIGTVQSAKTAEGIILF